MSRSVRMFWEDGRIFPRFLFPERWSTGHTLLPGSLLTPSGWCRFFLCLLLHLLAPLQHHDTWTIYSTTRLWNIISFYAQYAAEVMHSAVQSSWLWWQVALAMVDSTLTQDANTGFTFPNHFWLYMKISPFMSFLFFNNGGGRKKKFKQSKTILVRGQSCWWE